MITKPSFSGFFGKLSEVVTIPYAGPLDGRGDIQYAYSINRLLNTSYTGPSFKVRRSSDNSELDINFLASGYLDTTTLLNFCSGTDGYVSVLYDHSGNAYDLQQLTAINQPKVVSSGNLIIGLNGLHTIRFDETSNHHLESANSNYPDPPSFTIFHISGSGTRNDYGSLFQFGFFQEVNFKWNSAAVRWEWQLYDNTGSTTAAELFTSINTTSTWFRNRVDHVGKTYQAKYKAFNTTVNRTGSFTGTRSSSNYVLEFGSRNSLYFVSHDFHEFILLNSDCGTTDFATLESDIETMYGV